MHDRTYAARTAPLAERRPLSASILVFGLCAGCAVSEPEEVVLESAPVPPVPGAKLVNELI
ncbi:MAG: hypothetical protein AAF726_21980, partial [Planctomycetota bacterium]